MTNGDPVATIRRRTAALLGEGLDALRIALEEQDWLVVDDAENGAEIVVVCTPPGRRGAPREPPVLVFGGDGPHGLPPDPQRAIVALERVRDGWVVEGENRALRHHNSQLSADLVALRGRLDEAGRDAAAATRTKSTLLANMSHELRTPLNAILGYAELLQEDARELGARSMVSDLQKIHGAGHSLLSLINDILELARIEAGRAEMFLEPFQVGELCQEVLASVDGLARSNGNTVDLALDEAVSWLVSDRRKARQCLFNLLSNACKFTQAGRVLLEVAPVAVGGRDWVSFAISDTGIGLTQDEQQEIFEEFRQGDAAATRHFDGAGLGLAVTLRLSEVLGGSLSVDSERGRGSTFTLRLPDRAEDTEDTEAGVAGTPVPLPPRVTTEADPITVLVIDDDGEMRQLMQRYLSDAGYRVILARNGSEGVRYAEAYQPDAICLDAVMPEMDGFATLAALKGKPELAVIPVVMVTMVDDRSRGMVLGASDYLLKPVRRETLAAALERVRAAGSAERPVLVVDDDRDTRDMTRRMLQAEGMTVEVAANGREALAQLEQRLPSLVLLDLMMPEVDGFEVLARMRAREAWRDIPVVVITAMDLPPSQRRLLEHQVTSVVGKGGMVPERLIEEVRSAVGRRTVRSGQPS